MNDINIHYSSKHVIMKQGNFLAWQMNEGRKSLNLVHRVNHFPGVVKTGVCS